MINSHPRVLHLACEKRIISLSSFHLIHFNFVFHWYSYHRFVKFTWQSSALDTAYRWNVMNKRACGLCILLLCLLFLLHFVLVCLLIPHYSIDLNRYQCGLKKRWRRKMQKKLPFTVCNGWMNEKLGHLFCCPVNWSFLELWSLDALRLLHFVRFFVLQGLFVWKYNKLQVPYCMSGGTSSRLFFSFAISNTRGETRKEIKVATTKLVTWNVASPVTWFMFFFLLENNVRCASCWYWEVYLCMCMCLCIRNYGEKHETKTQFACFLGIFSVF